MARLESNVTKKSLPSLQSSIREGMVVLVENPAQKKNIFVTARADAATVLERIARATVNNPVALTYREQTYARRLFTPTGANVAMHDEGKFYLIPPKQGQIRLADYHWLDVTDIPPPEAKGFVGPQITVRTIFDPRVDMGLHENHSSQYGMPLPNRIRRAGTLLNTLRLRGKVDSEEIGNAAGWDGAAIEDFENGHRIINLRRAFHGAAKYFDEQEPEMVEFNNIVNEEQWIQTLTKGTFSRDGITLGNAITLLRLNKLQSKKEFYDEAHVAITQSTKIEQDRVTPMPYIINQIIETAGLAPICLPAQQIRLLREKRLPMTLAQLQKCTFNQLFQYLRQLQGYSRYDVQKQIGKRTSRSLISAIESGKHKPSKETKNKLIAFLKLDPKSALAEIIQAKAANPPKFISNGMIQRVLTEEHGDQYLFAESLQQYGAAEIPAATTVLYELETKKQQLTQSDQSDKMIGALLQHMRQNTSVGPRELARRAEMSHGDISKIERGEYVPEDVTITKLLVGLGYDIHHPVTWYLLDIAKSMERRLT
ncbi:MAG TPA: helix-turn-helix transcriptional regulator [Candidatus Sulfotelmatobacter sp.]|jgi:transcriptional regulator with XRE-family HTH domain|nr:helix-turn-helix transcriptional regulator [Candidatus Sulfotelmatobacter sp.]